ncbi:sigma-70 family RNA polymerase sigma factor [Chloroflexi bacterium TSY]|nr:sigma-70 family RNA polymerase sigma factor [Chloroflexi bacterium TSY]
MNEIHQLVERAQNDDSEAFALLVERFQDMAVGYSYSMLGDLHLAQDVAQDAFINAYLNLHSLRDPAAFPGWFRCIVATQVNRLQRRKQHTLVSLDRLPHLSSEELDLEMIAEREEMRHLINTMIQCLPDHQRTVVTLFYMGSYSQKEIGAFLEIPIATVKTRLYAARQQLKERMMLMIQNSLFKPVAAKVGYKFFMQTEGCSRISPLMVIFCTRLLP